MTTLAHHWAQSSCAPASLLRIIGCSSQEVLADLSLPRDIFRFPEPYAQVIAACREKGIVQGAETEWRRRDGGLVMVKLNARRLTQPDSSNSYEIVAEDFTNCAPWSGNCAKRKSLKPSVNLRAVSLTISTT